ncbi:lytic transglycosylase domain-containing protein [Brucella intermedia]|uniref:lytic transglycosylase domain-containing protein n=1 Tax=Brucella intermedia TaxID=94625 RepID=UPI002361F062|nr:lytic transglycosylase domain-containing protein [Brucella intermedia]
MPVALVDMAQQCAPQIEVETLAAVVSVESGFRPFVIRINSDRALEDQPQTRAEAIETASILIADGIDVDLGLGGINSSDLGRVGLSVSDAFDFCLNLQASASLLDGYYQIAVRAGAMELEAETVMLRSYYGRGDPSIGELVDYDGRVLAERERLGSDLSSINISEEQTNEPQWPDRGRELAAGSDTVTTPEHARGRSEANEPQWDVFNSGRQSSVLVFSNEQQE